MAGSRTPEALSAAAIRGVIRAAGREPVERDTLYRRLEPGPVLLH
jgi:aminodeoxyfutalosine synthase